MFKVSPYNHLYLPIPLPCLTAKPAASSYSRLTARAYLPGLAWTSSRGCRTSPPYPHRPSPSPAEHCERTYSVKPCYRTVGMLCAWTIGLAAHVRTPSSYLLPLLPLHTGTYARHAHYATTTPLAYISPALTSAGAAPALHRSHGRTRHCALHHLPV